MSDDYQLVWRLRNPWRWYLWLASMPITFPLLIIGEMLYLGLNAVCDWAKQGDVVKVRFVRSVIEQRPSY